MASRGEPDAGPRAGVWTPTLAPPPARGAVLWVLLVAAGAGAALVVVRWAGGRGDAFTNAGVLSVIGGVGVAGVARRSAPARTRSAPAAPAPAVLSSLQAVGVHCDAGGTNAFVGACLAAPVVYLLSFLLRRPAAALPGAIVTLAAAVALQLALP